MRLWSEWITDMRFRLCRQAVLQCATFLSGYCLLRDYALDILMYEIQCKSLVQSYCNYLILYITSCQSFALSPLFIHYILIVLHFNLLVKFEWVIPDKPFAHKGFKCLVNLLVGPSLFDVLVYGMQDMVINQPVNQPNNRSISQSINQSINQ